MLVWDSPRGVGALFFFYCLCLIVEHCWLLDAFEGKVAHWWGIRVLSRARLNDKSLYLNMLDFPTMSTIFYQGLGWMGGACFFTFCLFDFIGFCLEYVQNY